MSEIVHEGDLLEAIRQAYDEMKDGAADGTVTRAEVQELMGFAEAKALRVCKQLIDAGYLRPAWVHRVDGWGIRRKRMGYRWAVKPTAEAQETHT